MTEDEAKTKWCPFAQLVTTEQGSVAVRIIAAPAGYNRYSGAPKVVSAAATCIGSACMAWRKSGGAWVSRTHTPDQVAAALRPEDVNAVWSLEGFCGLAGSQ